MPNRLKKVAAGVAVLVASALGGAALAQGGGSDDGDETVSGPAADKATAAALKATDGGKANSVERDGENGATWEVEVTEPGGKTVDVRLDENFDLVVIEDDSEDDSGDSEDESR